MTTNIQAPNRCVPTEERRARHVVAPRCDIHENDQTVCVTAEMPGVDRASVDVTLERNVLTIQGRTQSDEPAGYRLLWREFGAVDYRRSFELSNEVQGTEIRATMQDGIWTQPTDYILLFVE